VHEYYRDELKKRKVRKRTMKKNDFHASLKKLQSTTLKLKHWNISPSDNNKKKKDKTKVQPINHTPSKTEVDAFVTGNANLNKLEFIVPGNNSSSTKSLETKSMETKSMETKSMETKLPASTPTPEKSDTITITDTTETNQEIAQPKKKNLTHKLTKLVDTSSEEDNEDGDDENN
jgi:hypothetical protein